MTLHIESRRCRRTLFGAAILAVALLSSSRALAQSVTIPEGTAIAVRTIDAVDSEANSANKDYRATVDDSVVVGSATVIPTGCAAVLRVMQVGQADAFSGRASVSLRLVALEINGQTVPVQTGEATIKSGSQGAKTGKSAAVGAVVGGILGGLLGGKKGLVRGAVAGGATGAVVAAVSGQKVKVAPETRLSFTLSQSIEIQQN